MENLFEKLPKEFVDKQKEMLSIDDFERYKQAINDTPVRGLRVNKKRVNIEEFVKKTNLSLRKLPFCDDGFVFESDEKIGNSSNHLSGVVYLQEPSSMLAVCASEIEKENRALKILDLCASPGGKSSQIASRISDDSILFSNEIIKSRSQVLFSNIERQGFKNVVVLNETPQNLSCFERYFDYVFVDAPCSGEGMFRKNPETISEWSEENVKICANRQKEILEIAHKLVAPGGKLIYSTCTFSLEEDEKIVEWLVNEKKYELLNINDNIKKVTISSKAKIKNKEFARKFYPHVSEGEGQFISVFKNNSEEGRSQLHKKKHYNSIFEIGRSEYLAAEEFFSKNLNIDVSRKLIKVGESIYLKPESFNQEIQTMLDSLKFVSIGIRVGAVVKGRFEPHHNLFMALNNEFKTKIELSDENLKKYLHGEEIMCDITPQKSGVYVVLTKNNQPIGGGKLIGSKIKNLYPKGMRI